MRLRVCLGGGLCCRHARVARGQDLLTDGGQLLAALVRVLSRLAVAPFTYSLILLLKRPSLAQNISSQMSQGKAGGGNRTASHIHGAQMQGALLEATFHNVQ